MTFTIGSYVEFQDTDGGQHDGVVFGVGRGGGDGEETIKLWSPDYPEITFAHLRLPYDHGEGATWLRFRPYPPDMYTDEGKAPLADREMYARMYLKARQALEADQRAVANGERYTTRARIMDTAKDLITGDRNVSYGPPTMDFVRIAEQLQAMGYRAPGRDGPGTRDMRSSDFPLIMQAVKISRALWSDKEDNPIDGAGYWGTFWECREEELKGEGNAAGG